MRYWKGLAITLAVLAVIIILIIGSFLIWLYRAQDDEVEITLEFSKEEYPKVDGSTSTHPLGVLIACRILDIPYDWKEDEFTGVKDIVPTGDYQTDKDVQFITDNTRHNGTHSAYVNLIEKEADFILVAREPSEDELDLARTNGVDLVAEPIALDAFVFILNKDNPLDSLTLDQIKDIYTGNITRWSQIGGGDHIISPYQRNDNSGSQELMESLVMKGEEMVDAPEMILYGMMGPINALSVDAYGIGYSVYFYEQFMAPNDKIKLCGVDGVIPAKNTIISGEYEFVTGVYAAIREDTTNEDTAFQLRDWLLTEEGCSVIEESGYVPI